VIIWAAITITGKTPLVFVEKRVKINRWNYIEMLEEHLLPWASNLFDDEEWCFQQDSEGIRQTKLKIGCLNIVLVSSQEEWSPNFFFTRFESSYVWSIWKERHAQNHTRMLKV
jgi:hypothetical protein